MTIAVPSSAPARSPQQMTAVLGVAVGAVGAAVLGTHAGDVSLPDVGATTAELDLAALHTTGSGAAAVAPVAAEATSAAATVPELTKAAGRHAHDAVIEGAIQRFESRIGTTRYEGYCERAVENAFGTQGHYGSAIQDWRSQDQHTDFRNAPRGAMVFYNTSSNGHVALSLGDGRVVSSSAHGRVGIVPIDHFQRPLGWAYAPY
jgi:hypothetical protein